MVQNTMKVSSCQGFYITKILPFAIYRFSRNCCAGTS